MSAPRIIPEPTDGRVETGVVQFGDDWPGVFIRGDNAFGYALALGAVMKGEANVIQLNRVGGLLGLLRRSNVHGDPA